MDFKIPEYVKKVMSHLAAEGFEAFVVGGCVRDICLNKTPLDWDVCTNATPDIMLEIFSKNFKVLPTGIKHGTVTVISDKNAIEVTTYRSDGDYCDNRHPESVKFLPSIEGDLARRDFTVNAIAYNTNRGFIDLFGGLCDIKNKVLRTVGDAKTRFSEDALRILRGLRFSATCSFEIESETKNAIHASKNLLKSVSQERIYAELKKLLLAKSPAKILTEYEDVFKVILPEVSFNHYALSLIDKASQDIALRLAILLLFADEPHKALTRLKIDANTQKKTLAIISNSDSPLPYDRVSAKKALNKLGADLLNLVLEIYGIKSGNFDETAVERNAAKAIVKEVLESGECYCLDMLNISGSDLIASGFEAGPEIGQTLNALLNYVIEGKIENKTKILINYAKKSLT